MAEAIRSLPIKNKRKLRHKGQEKSIKGHEKEEDPLDVIYDNYKDVDILRDETADSQVKNYTMTSVSISCNNVDAALDISNKLHAEHEEINHSTKMRIHEKVPEEEKSFRDLNKQLHNLQPYHKAQEGLVQIEEQESVSDIVPEPLVPSAPQISEVDNKISSPRFCSPMSKLSNDSLIRQRCLEPIDDLATEISKNKIEPMQEKLKLKPYTEIQILTLYDNAELEEKEKFISCFLEHEKSIALHPFNEIVLNYLRARTHLMGTEKQIKTIIEDYKKQKEGVWTFEEKILSEEGLCEDDQLLTVTYKHQVASYHSKIAKHVSKQLKQIREITFDSYALHVYSTEISKLQVENYLQNAITSCPEFTAISKNSPIRCCFSDHTKDLSNHVDHLKDCISILMSFCRRNVQDNIFLREVRTWLSDTIAILLRVASLKDHLFIINHLMRCPMGVGDWGAHFIQVVPPQVSVNQDLFGSPLLDHLVTMLALILQPAREREDYIRHFKISSNDTEGSHPGDNSWIVVDSSGEDEEDDLEIWHYFSENDIIQFINQIPFEEMFKHVLLVESDGDDLTYDVSKASQHSLMKLFAFCTRLLTIFQEGLRTYHQARFKGVVKRLSRLIRHTVHYVTDHWRGFVAECQKRGEITSTEDNAMAVRLQVEYDEFFENAVKTVFLSPRCGAWQFLAVIPYNCVSLERLWTIAFKLHIGFEEVSIPDLETEDWPLMLKSKDTKGRFHDRLLTLGDSESYYLLTALANMAIVRTEKERHFIQAIVSNLFDTTMVNEDLRTTLNRTGRDLFLTISGAHPFTVSSLLSEIQEKLHKVGSLSLYLFRFLCLEEWQPTEEDLQCLSYWVIYTPASSLECQLARIILAKMNWGFDPSGTRLALSRSIHQRIALLVVDVATKLQTKIGQGNLISEGVKQVTSVVYAPSPEQVFLKWCWSMLNQLHLHQMDQPDLEVRRVLANQSLILRGIGDPSTSPTLDPLKKGIASKNPLTIFATLLMSSWGHSVPEICNRVPDGLELMVWNGQSDAALTVLSLISPLFFNQHEELISDARLVNALVCILSADQTYVNLAKSYITSDLKGSVLNLFEGLIMDQILHYERFNLENRSPIFKFWIDLFVLIPNWKNNLSVLKLIDLLCQCALFDHPSWQVLKEVFTEQRKILHGEKGGKGGLGGLFSWVSSGSSGSSSLLSRSNASEVPWFALCVLICEAQEEMSSGLWKDLLKKLQANPEVPLETALKEVCSRLNIQGMSSGMLCLYRLGQQLLDLPCSHVAFPATAQIFFVIHLSRTPPQAGQYDCANMIYKFYEGYLNSNFLKKIKHKVGDAFTFWESALAKEKNADKEVLLEEEGQARIRFLSTLVGLLGTMSTWLEETKLYETGLYIPALPPQLMPKKLLLLFQENWDLWPELTDRDLLHSQFEGHAKMWRSHRHFNYPASSPASASSSPSHHNLSDAKESRRLEDLTPAESILKRLKEYDAPKPPPPLPSHLYKRQRQKSTTQNKDSIQYDVERFTSLIAGHSRTMLLKSKEMCALDCVCAELLPQLWTNPVTKTVLTAKCKPKKNARIVECSGSAKIVVEYCEKRRNEGTKARLDQNREQYLTVFNSSTQGPPLNVCEAALQLVDLVNTVVFWHKEIRSDCDEKVALVSFGRDLFFHFVQLTSEETNSYPPAKQLITACTDTLGQEFLRGHRDCQENLAMQVLQLSPQYGVLLSPHFTPMVTPIDVYLSSYASLIPNVSAQPDLCFMLLSKFETEAWLREKKVGRNERSKLIQCVCSSLSSIMALGNEATITCLELYRVHLRAILSFNFPEHLSEILTLLLDISVASADCGDVRRNIWYDLLNTLSNYSVEFNPDMTSSELVAAIKTLVQTQSFVSPVLVKELITVLSSYFLRQRIESGHYGLYVKYKSDVKPVTCFLGVLSFAYVLTASVTSQHSDLKQLSLQVWNDLEGLWTAWVSPLGGKARASCPQWIQELTSDQRALLPWTPGDVTGPSQAVAIFVSSLFFFHENYVGCNVLSICLEYYHATYASPEVKDHVLCVVHPHFSSLPWHRLSPSLKDLEIFYKIINEYLPECHSFVGSIFIQIPWDKVVRDFTAEASGHTEAVTSPTVSPDAGPSSPSSLVKLHSLMLNILVGISLEPSARQSGLLLPLLVSAEEFHWRFLDAKNFESVLNWFVMSCDPRIGLQMENRNPIDVALLRLLHVAASYTRVESSNPHRCGPLKRRLLVRAICRLLTTAATRHKALLSARKALFAETFAGLMNHMEEVVEEGLPPEAQFDEGLHLSTETVNLIGGGASPPPLQEVCKDSLIEWLKEGHSSRAFLLPLAASISKGIHHLHHRSPVLEECLVAIFNHADFVGEREALCGTEVARALSFPITNPLVMLNFAAQENHLLVIYVHTKWRMNVRKVTSEEHLFVLINLIEVLNLVNPNESCENWLLLVLGETIGLIRREIEESTDYERLWVLVNSLIDRLFLWGEDSVSAGILAAFGLGRKSLLSTRVRLICKSLGTFLKSQLLNPGFFCSVNEHNRDISNSEDERNTPCSSSLKDLQHLLSLRSNALYTHHSNGLTFALKFIQDCRHSILDAHVLFDGLLSNLFPKGSVVLQLRRTDVSETPLGSSDGRRRAKEDASCVNDGDWVLPTFTQQQEDANPSAPPME